MPSQTSNPTDLTGRHIIVTGASDGLGAEISRAAARAGAKVVLAARRKEKLEALQTEITDNGGEALAVSMDVSDETSTIAGFDSAEAAFGPLHGLVANAGISADAWVVDQSAEDFDRTMSVNLRGVFLSVREAGRRIMKQDEAHQKRGRVVINASYTAHQTFSTLSAYAASKAGAVQYGRVTAREWARSGINVNVLCPGYLSTPMTDDLFNSPAGEKFKAKFPRRRVMSADALNDMTVFLLSDASKYITGSVFTLDDGQSL